MQASIGIVIAIIAACWLLVLGHQLGLEPFSDPDRYAALKGSLAAAYVVAALSVCALGILALAFFKK